MRGRPEMVNWKQVREQAVDVEAEPPRIDPKRPLAHLSDAELQHYLQEVRRHRDEMRRQFDEAYQALAQL